MLTPMDIHNHEFKRSFRGYNENEVDEFLDMIVSDYEKLLRENEKLKERTTLNEREISHYKTLEQNLQDTLMVAQKTAEEVIGSARRNAKEVKENAVNDAQSLHENTMREAQNIRMQAQLDAKQRIDEATSKLHAVVFEYDKIVREKNTFLLKMRSALETELAVIMQLLSSVPNQNEAEAIKSAALKLEQDIKAPAPETIAQPIQNIEPEPINPSEQETKPIPATKSATKKSKSDTTKPVDNDKNVDTATYEPVKKISQ